MPRTNAAEAQRIAERIRIQFAEAARKVDGDAVDATVSVGVATATMPAQLSDLVAAADDALYRAKAEGRNRVMAVDCAASAAGQAVVVPIRARSAA